MTPDDLSVGQTQLSDYLSQHILNRIPAAVYRCAYSKEWRDLYISPAIQPLVGYSKKQFETGEKSFLDLVDPDQVHKVQKQYRKLLKKSDRYETDLRVICADKSVKWIKDVGMLTRPGGGQAPYIDGVLLDITDRKTLQFKHKVAMRALEQESAFRDRALNLIAHEIRTPLNAVYGFSQLLHTSVAAGDSEAIPKDVARHLEHIYSSADLLKRIVDDALRALAHKEPTARDEERNFSILEATRFAVSLMKAAGDPTPQLDIDADALSHGIVLGSRTHFIQAVSNIVSNVVKHGGGGATLSVTASATQSGDIFVLFDDDGPGVAEDALQDVFFPFRKAPDTENLAASGLGVGLHLVREVAEGFEGRLYACQSPKGGFRLIFLIPAHRAIEAPEPGAKDPTRKCERIV